MRILHLPDLLVDDTADVPYLAEATVRWLESRHVDLIVVSGDLTRTGAAAEFERLDGLLVRLVRQLLDGRRERLVVVPGNHDVSQDAEVLLPVPNPRNSDEAEQLKQDVANYRRNPATSALRLRIDEDGTVEWMRRDPTARTNRGLDHFLAWSDSFYKGQPRVFPFTPARRLWCYHRIEDLKCLVLGWFSGRHIDKYWDGASIEDEMVDEAKAAVDEDLPGGTKDYLVVGTWHHGFTGHVGRPDRLSLRDLDRIRRADVKLGLYGHHAEEATVFDFDQNRMIVSGAGRFPTTGTENPTTRQFAYLVASRMHVRWELLTAREDRPPKSEHVKHLSLHRRLTHETGWSDEQSWWWTVRTDGITALDTNFRGVRSDASSIQLFPSEGRLARLKPAKDDGDINVAWDDASAKTWFVLHPSGPDSEAADTLDALSGVLYGAGVAAMTADDLALLPDRQAVYPRLLPGLEVITTTLRLSTAHLTLGLDWEHPGGRLTGAPPPEEVWPYVEKPVLHQGELVYEQVRDVSYLRRVTVARHEQQTRWTFEVDEPVPGWRYGFVYRPAGRRSEVYDHAVKTVVTALLDLAASGPRSPQLSESIREAIDDALEKYLGSTLSSNGIWTFYVLDLPSRRMVPVLASLDSRVERTFAIGTGITGHAARMRRMVLWHHDVSGYAHPAFVRSRHVDTEPRWIVAIPIVVQGVPVATLGLSSHKAPTSPAEHILDAAARGSGTALEDRLNNLWAYLDAVIMFRVQEYVDVDSVKNLAKDAMDDAHSPVSRSSGYRELADVFLSFSRVDAALAESFAVTLRKEGLRVWDDGESFPDRAALGTYELARAVGSSRAVVELRSSGSTSARPLPESPSPHGRSRFVLLLDRHLDSLSGPSVLPAWSAPLRADAAKEIAAARAKLEWEWDYFFIDLTGDERMVDRTIKALRGLTDARIYVNPRPRNRPANADTVPVALDYSRTVVVFLSTKTPPGWQARADVKAASAGFRQGSHRLCLVSLDGPLKPVFDPAIPVPNVYLAASPLGGADWKAAAAADFMVEVSQRRLALKTFDLENVGKREALAMVLRSLFDEETFRRWLTLWPEGSEIFQHLSIDEEGPDIFERGSEAIDRTGLVSSAIHRLSIDFKGRRDDIHRLREIWFPRTATLEDVHANFRARKDAERRWAEVAAPWFSFHLEGLQGGDHAGLEGKELLLEVSTRVRKGRHRRSLVPQAMRQALARLVSENLVDTMVQLNPQELENRSNQLFVSLLVGDPPDPRQVSNEMLEEWQEMERLLDELDILDEDARVDRALFGHRIASHQLGERLRLRAGSHAPKVDFEPILQRIQAGGQGLWVIQARSDAEASAVLARLGLDSLGQADGEPSVLFAGVSVHETPLAELRPHDVAKAIVGELATLHPQHAPILSTFDNSVLATDEMIEEQLSETLGRLVDAQTRLVVIFDSLSVVPDAPTIQRLQRLLDPLFGALPNLVVVTAGVPPELLTLEARSADVIEVSRTDARAAQEALQGIGVPPTDARALTLRLDRFPDLLAHARRLENVGPLPDDFWTGLDEAHPAADLYLRFAELFGPAVRTLAYLGATVRRITADVLLDILDQPCELGLRSDDKAAQDLIASLRSIPVLFKNNLDFSARLSRPVRRVILPKLLEANPSAMASIHVAAANWYGTKLKSNHSASANPQGNPVALEEAYHRTWATHFHLSTRGLPDHWAVFDPGLVDELPWLSAEVQHAIHGPLQTAEFEHRAKQLEARGDLGGVLALHGRRPELAEIIPATLAHALASRTPYQASKHAEYALEHDQLGPYLRESLLALLPKGRPEAERALTELLRRMFSVEQLRRFARNAVNGDEVVDGIQWDSKSTDVIADYTQALVDRGLVNDEFFDRLTFEQPWRRSQTRKIQRLWRQGEEPSNNP